jgi:hypothetical protein
MTSILDHAARRTALSAAAAILLTMLSACGHRSPQVPLTRDVFIPDLSPSDNGEAMQSICLAAFKRVAAHAAANQGTLTVETIDGNPLQDSRTPIDIRFTVPAQFEGNPAYADPIMEQLQASAADQMAKLLATPPHARGTDVLRAMELAGRVFARPSLAPGPGSKYLIVCSDMMNSIPPFNFYQLGLSDRQVSRLIDQLKATGWLPQLAGVRVYVVGAGGSTSGKITAAKNQSVESLWTRYFRAAGAELMSYAATLPSFP